MTTYDAAMVGVILAGMVWGAFKGITWQLASILSLVIGYSVAQPLSIQLAPKFPGDPVVARALAMIAIYLGVAGAVFFAAWLVRATLKKLQFEAFDRHLGMLLGGVEGALLGMIATLFVVSLAPQSRGPIFQSTSGKVVGQVMSALGPILPKEARGVIAPFLNEADAPVVEVKPGPSLSEEISTLTGTNTTTATAAAPAVAPKDADTSPASLSDMLQESERRIGRAVIDGATESLKRATNGGTTNGPNSAVKRR
jgi:membrane protein required for colicin V production